MKAKFLTPLITEHLIDNRFVKLYEPFKYYSEVLQCIVDIPKDFICDFESVPIAKGSSKRAGTLHDYFCRIDSVPVVTKQQAADVYFEAQECKDVELKKKGLSKFWKFFVRHFKTTIVRVVPGYYHKKKVLSTLEEFV